MGQLTNLYVSQSYQGLLKLTDSTTGLTTSLQSVQDGIGGNSPLQISTTQVNISGSFFINNVPITNGTNGTSGTSGSSGSSGSSGTSGQSGSSGSTGSGGSSGSSGTSGSNGSSGTSGSSGDSLFALTGSVWNTTNNIGITGSLNVKGDINISGSIIPTINDVFDLGSTTKQFRDLYLSSGSLFLDGSKILSLEENTDNTVIAAKAEANTIRFVNDITFDATGSNPGVGGRFRMIGAGTNKQTETEYSGSRHFFRTNGDLVFTNQTDSPETQTGSISFNVDGGGPLILNADSSSYINIKSDNGNIRVQVTGSNGGNLFLGSNSGRVEINSKDTINVTGSMGITGSFSVSNLPSGSSSTEYVVYNTTTKLLETKSGTVGSSGTSGTSGGTGSSGTSGSSGTGGGDRNGLITTGSIVDTQQITGSLILGNTVISGSLVGNSVNSGIIKIQSEGNISGSVQFNITSSSPVSQSNLIFGQTTGPSAANQTGSIVISGSNNILLNGFRTNTLLNSGTYGYLGGSGNIGNTIPTLGTGSLLRPTINNNVLQGSLSLQFTTSSLGQGTVASNLIYGTTNINHQSGSVSMQGNYVGINAFTSNANTTTLGLNPSYIANIIAGITFPNITLNNNSSSITYQGNIGGGMTVTNNYSSSVSTAVNNATVTGNILGGQSNTLVISGSNTSNRRTFDSNVVIGRSNVINSQQSGSSAGHLVSTAILGDNLIVSASHTSITAGGTVIVGRFNATGSLQESSQDAIFVVGTGTAAGSRRNAIHVDSNNNTRITGSVLISGSLNSNGNTGIIGSLNVVGDIQFSSGSNKTMGTVALDGGNPGTATVSNTLVTANSLIYLTKQTNNHPNAGPVVVSSKGSSTFTITSNHNADTDTVAYLIVNPA